MPCRHPPEAVSQRLLPEAQPLLLADVVQSFKFLSERKSATLVKSLGKLASKHLADDLKRRVHVESRIKTQNESMFYNIDAIQRAMTAKRKISFLYFKHDETKSRVLQHDGERYVETPVRLVYMDDCYYVIVWSDKHEGFANYREDCMLGIEVRDEEATKNDQIATFDVGRYQQKGVQHVQRRHRRGYAQDEGLCHELGARPLRQEPACDQGIRRRGHRVRHGHGVADFLRLAHPVRRRGHPGFAREQPKKSTWSTSGSSLPATTQAKDRFEVRFMPSDFTTITIEQAMCHQAAYPFCN